MPEKPRLLIVGIKVGTSVGYSLYRATGDLALDSELIDFSTAYHGNILSRQFNWRLRQRRPAHLKAFNKHLVEQVEIFRPDVLLCTGLAPVTRQTLERIKANGTVCLNYQTDDPWNPAHRSKIFLEALPTYDAIFTPRKTTIADLGAAGCNKVSYLPFAFDDHIFTEEAIQISQDYDVAFVGGADKDRLPLVEKLISEGLSILLYGNSWQKYRSVRGVYQGLATPDEVRHSIVRARVNICVGRKANRDGHCMRTFEVPAMRGCMLAEDSDEHREIFGEEGTAAYYFSNLSEMIEKTRLLMADDGLRDKLATNGFELIRTGNHTYRDRLLAMITSTQV